MSADDPTQRPSAPPPASADAWPRPSFTVDVVALRWHSARLEVLLIERARPPFAGAWALPGGFVDAGEAPEAAAARELVEETGVTSTRLHPVGVFGAPGRDPRGWVVSAAYLWMAPTDCRAVAGDDARHVAWHPMAAPPTLAFDHAEILDAARARLTTLAQTSTEPLALLGEAFRTRAARHLYAQILGREVSPTAFKAWLRRRGAVERVGPARFRPAESLRDDWLR